MEERLGGLPNHQNCEKQSDVLKTLNFTIKFIMQYMTKTKMGNKKMRKLNLKIFNVDSTFFLFTITFPLFIKV